MGQKTIALGAATLLLFLLWPWFADGRPRAAHAAEGDSCALFDHNHAAWTAVLKRHVRNGSVDYAGLKRDGVTDLNGYLKSLESVCKGHYQSWTSHQKLAFWINAYNAYTIRLIIDHYPVKSIRKIGLLPNSAFKKKFIPLTTLRAKTLSLNDLEHNIIRKEFAEPRIHFAIVCASKGCPVLRSEAYRAPVLDRQLQTAAQGFVQDRSKNRFDPETRKLHLSAIFDWFREDFERDGKTLPEFVARYMDETTAKAIGSGAVRVQILEYDWSLNGR
jgi:hypothetical protein